jgi:hypothetical protein
MFFETGYFHGADTELILKAEEKNTGWFPKIHVNQFTAIGRWTGVKTNALSVDHLEEMQDASIKVLEKTRNNTSVYLVAVPSFLLYTPALKMIDAGCHLPWQLVIIRIHTFW